MWLCLWCCAYIWFQEPKDPAITDQMTVSYVLLDIAVHDRKGDPVTDLTLEDFTITDGGKKVKPNSFHILELNLPPEDRDGKSLEVIVETQPTPSNNKVEPGSVVRQVQQIAFVLDMGSSKSNEAKAAVTQIRQFLLELPKNVSYRINLLEMEKGSLTRGWVTDPEEAAAALDRFDEDYFVPSGKVHASNTTPLSAYRVNNIADYEEALYRCYHTFGAKTGDSGNGFKLEECIDYTVEAFLQEHADRARRLVGELETLTYAFLDTEGMKTIFLVSPGFTIQGFDSIVELAEDYRSPRNSDQAEFGSAMPLRSVSNRSFRGEFKEIEEEYLSVIHGCVRNRIVFHTFDIFNIDTDTKRRTSARFSRSDNLTGRSGGFSGSERTSRVYRQYETEITEGMDRLAKDSGGTFNKTFHLLPAFQRISATDRFYYVIGWESPSGRKGKYRKIKVKVKRRGVDVRHRDGYFGN